MKNTLLKMLLSVIILIPVSLGILYWHVITHARIGINVPDAKRFHVKATKANYFFSYAFNIYEYDIPEKFLIEIAGEKNWQLSAIEDVGIKMKVVPFESLGELLKIESGVKDIKLATIRTKIPWPYWITKLIKHGYYFSEDRGALMVAYDTDEQRLYFFGSRSL